MVKIWNISFCGSIDTGMYSNGSVCTQKETEHNSGSSSIGIGGVLGNCVWLNCIYQDRNYSAVWISTILVMERYYSLPWLLDAADDVDKVYVEEVLPGKMKYNLDALKEFSIIKELVLMIKTFLAVIKE